MEVTSFVVSFIPKHEFKSSSNIHLSRPLCVISYDVCARQKVITHCEELIVETKRFGIVNKSDNLVYIVSNFGTKPTTCFDLSNFTNCCSYVNPTDGICREYPRFRFDYERKDDEPKHDIKSDEIKNENDVKKESIEKSKTDKKEEVNQENIKTKDVMNEDSDSQDDPVEEKQVEAKKPKKPKKPKKAGSSKQKQKDKPKKIFD